MALLKRTINVYGKLDDLFEKLLEGQAPSKFTREFLGDLGFTSSSWHAVIGLLKNLGFLTANGSPTAQYMEFLDKTKSKQVLARAVKKAYSDIFVMKRDPSPSDLAMISGKYKSTYNMPDVMAERAARTFLALLKLADKDVVLGNTDSLSGEPVDKIKKTPEPQKAATEKEIIVGERIAPRPVDFSYNIQIHLPATKDIEVYNAIFKSLREHIID